MATDDVDRPINPSYQDGFEARTMPGGGRERRNPYIRHSVRYRRWEAGWADADQGIAADKEPAMRDIETRLAGAKHADGRYVFGEEVRVKCPGYAYFGHKALDVDGYYATCEYKDGKDGGDDDAEEDVDGPDNRKVITLVREALRRDDPMDNWLERALNQAHVGDTAIREGAYLTVMTNLPHPPCQGRGWTASRDLAVWLDVVEPLFVDMTMFFAVWWEQWQIDGEPAAPLFTILEQAVQQMGAEMEE